MEDNQENREIVKEIENTDLKIGPKAESKRNAFNSLSHRSFAAPCHFSISFFSCTKALTTCTPATDERLTTLPYLCLIITALTCFIML